MKKVIVIGAGAAGLAAAVRLQNSGYDVHLYEKNPQVGGKMYQIKEQGFTFDVGPTIVMMPEIYREVFEVCGRDPENYIPMKKVDPMLTLNFPNEEPLNFSSDLVSLTNTLEGISEDDMQGYLEYLASIYKRYQIAKKAFIMRSFRSFWDFYNPKSLIAGFKLHTFNDAYSSISKFVKDERLRKSLAFQTLYIGVSPYNGPSLYTIIPMIELIYGIWYIEGGMYSLATGMARLFEELGGTIHLNTSVKEIVLENKQAKGITTETGLVESDYVVCNADFPYAMKNLLPNEKDRGKYSNKKIDKMDYSCSCFILYLGLDKKYPVKSLHTIRFAADFEKNINDIFEDHRLPEDPSFYIYVPSSIDQSLAPDGQEGVYILVPVPELSQGVTWDETTTQEFRKNVLSLVKKETIFSDIEEHIIYEKCYTPKNFEQNFNAYNGATFGLKPTLKQSNYYRPHNKFDYADNLYFCGSSTHPGAGVPIVLTSAKLAVEELMKDDGQKK
ncbi:phytoene desaturase family protein [Enterococcus sp. 5H]|uniref:phytoene desaturase family protein n=1 Tax=Enterococcus sp. 5H TaxID=1229490 RepID=UPI0023022CBE|nr:phytoene desaturase family protein [Enterococcus sp. 5H]MDA9472173.1 Dehydrosqualene desaturase [Enterococcus sp. 5H]